MNQRPKSLLAAAACIAAAIVPATPASTGAGVEFPLFVGSDSAVEPQYLIDVVSGATMVAFTGTDAWGAAYDPAADRVLHNDGSTLYEWPVGGTVNMLGTIMEGGSPLTVHGLAFYGGELYATSITTDTIYTIDLSTLVATPIIPLVDTSASVSGLAIDQSTGEIYGTDDGTNDSLVLINADGTLTPVAPYAAGETDVDGLAISSDRKAYLITDDPTPPTWGSAPTSRRSPTPGGETPSPRSAGPGSPAP